MWLAAGWPPGGTGIAAAGQPVGAAAAVTR